jgi:hypothetical protein
MQPTSNHQIFLLAWGEEKAGIVARTVEGGVDPAVPATFLQHHPNTGEPVAALSRVCVWRGWDRDTSGGWLFC